MSSSLRAQREALPVYEFREEFIEAVQTHQTIICVGETGSGKTTQFPQYLVEAGFCKDGKRIGVTQHRRVAAQSVARRVSEEMGVVLGHEVGFKIRFFDNTRESTLLKYMTDGSLVREILVDPKLNEYSVIMLDEAHERSVDTDVLFGLLKQVLRSRPDLRLVVTSATLDTTRFSEHFDNCPIFAVPGRMFPVEVCYANKDPKRTSKTALVEASVDTVALIHQSEPEGDILLFLTGQEEIDKTCRELRAWSDDYDKRLTRSDRPPVGPRHLDVLPLYGALPTEQQLRVFEPPPPDHRKVVIATNIAETSLTVNGIRYVIDPGYVKQKQYSPETAMENLVIVPISKTAAMQRAGRAGRTAPGKCYRLYTKATHAKFVEDTIPEIMRSNLANTLLYLKVLGVHDVLGFEFIDPPSQDCIADGLKQLFLLGALDADGRVTPLGLEMSNYPLDPPVSRMLIESVRRGVSPEVITIAAMLSVESVYYHPQRRDESRGPVGEEADAIERHVELHHESGDHVTYLRVYDLWAAAGYTDEWCHKYFIHARAMKLARNIRKQLHEAVESASREANKHKEAKSRAEERKERDRDRGDNRGREREARDGERRRDDLGEGRRRSRSRERVDDKRNDRSLDRDRGRDRSSRGGDGRRRSSSPARDGYRRRSKSRDVGRRDRYRSRSRDREYRDDRRRASRSRDRDDGRKRSPVRDRRSVKDRDDEEKKQHLDGPLDAVRTPATVGTGTTTTTAVATVPLPTVTPTVPSKVYKVTRVRDVGEYHKSLVKQVTKCIVAGFYNNSAIRSASDAFRLTGEGCRLAFIHPQSALASFSIPQAVVFHEVVFTNRAHMRQATKCSPKWLNKLLPMLEQVDVARLSGREEVEATDGKEGDSTGGAVASNDEKVAAETAKAEAEAAKARKLEEARARYLARKQQESS